MRYCNTLRMKLMWDAPNHFLSYVYHYINVVVVTNVLYLKFRFRRSIQELADYCDASFVTILMLIQMPFNC